MEEGECCGLVLPFGDGQNYANTGSFRTSGILRLIPLPPVFRLWGCSRLLPLWPFFDVSPWFCQQGVLPIGGCSAPSIPIFPCQVTFVRQQSSPRVNLGFTGGEKRKCP